MKHKIVDLIDKAWSCDKSQDIATQWHAKQDLMQAVRAEFDAELANTRNKLGPVKNILAVLRLMVEHSNEFGFSGKIIHRLLTEIDISDKIVDEISKKDEK